MKKNVWKVLLVPALLSGLVACGNTDDTNEKEKDVTTPPKQEKTVEVKTENPKAEPVAEEGTKTPTETTTTEGPTQTEKEQTTTETPSTETTKEVASQTPTESTNQTATDETKVITEKGTFVGLIDGSSFEVTVNGQSRTLRFDSSLMPTINNYNEEQPVEIQYTKNSYGQLLLKSIK